MAIVGRISSSDAPVKKIRIQFHIGPFVVSDIFSQTNGIRFANLVQTNENAQTRTQFVKRNEEKDESEDKQFTS